MTGRTLRMPVLVVAAALAACAIALLAPPREAGAAFPGQNGRIAYVEPGLAPEDDEIYSMRPDGTDRRQLTDNSEDDLLPDTSPDGTEIAFMSLRSGVNKVYVMDADGTDVRDLSGAFTGDGSPAWSPDGGRLAFLHGGDIWTMDADGSDRKNLTNTGTIGGYGISEAGPSWSPDGTKIAFYRRTGKPGNTDLYTIGVDGAGLRRVTDYAGSEYTPDWSPSGHRIAFYGYTRVAGTRIFTVKPDGTGKRFIAPDGESPVWSPDGRRIAFNRGWDILKVASGGSGEPVAVDGPAGSRETLPDWGPLPAPEG